MNSFTAEMAQELIMLFNDASEEDEVGAIVVTGTGKAFCAGMDLSVEGNVFGLNESLSPSINQIQDDYNELEMVHGVRDTGGRGKSRNIRMQETSNRRNQWCRCGCRRNHDPRHGYSTCLIKSKNWVRVWKNRYHPGGLLDVVLAKDSRHATCAGWIYSADLLSPKEAKRGRAC